MNGDTTRKIKAIVQEKYDTFVRIFINHVFLCESCVRYLASTHLKKVVKDEKERRVCKYCGGEVKDVTHTPVAEHWRARVRPDLEIGA